MDNDQISPSPTELTLEKADQVAIKRDVFIPQNETKEQWKERANKEKGTDQKISEHIQKGEFEEAKTIKMNELNEKMEKLLGGKSEAQKVLNGQGVEAFLGPLIKKRVTDEIVAELEEGKEIDDPEIVERINIETESRLKTYKSSFTEGLLNVSDQALSQVDGNTLIMAILGKSYGDGSYRSGEKGDKQSPLTSDELVTVINTSPENRILYLREALVSTGTTNYQEFDKKVRLDDVNGSIALNAMLDTIAESKESQQRFIQGIEMALQRKVDPTLLQGVGMQELLRQLKV